MAMPKPVKPKTTNKFSPAAGTSQTATPTIAKPRPAVTPAPSYGPRRIGESILFIVSFPKASSVFIAGDFNAWNPHKTPLTKAPDGSWQVTIPLTKGVYKYRFVVDGNWQQDPHNNNTEPNEFAGLNSVLKVD